MRPIPAELSKLYPVPPDRWAERPWWRRWSTTQNAWQRSDGQWILLSIDESPSAKMTQVDRENPLPHPGLRAGQIWASWRRGSDLDTVCITKHWKAGDELFFCETREGEVIESGVDDMMESLNKVWGVEPHGPYFLLADPCCPHLAPWAPPETP